MAVAENYLPRIIKGDNNMTEIPIKEIEKELEFDKVEPLRGLTPSILKDLEDDEDYFRDMYEEDLRAYYESLKRER